MHLLLLSLSSSGHLRTWDMFLVVLILQYFTGYILHACRATDVLLLFFSCNEPSVQFLSGKLVSIVMVIADY